LNRFSRDDLARSLPQFREKLKRAKSRIQPTAFQWYPYDSLESIVHQIQPLLETVGDDMLERCRDFPLLDLGCGDGDIAFFFESLGFRVTAVDHELTNYNQMRGVTALRSALGSSVRILSADLDGRFQIDGGPFGLVLMLGLLYHVKNPFYLLEYAAQRAHYCLLTTRIAQRTPRSVDMSEEALAYLVDSFELNDDCTNYWIFSTSGLHRLVTRAGWKMDQFRSTGCRDGSDPITARGDERACCLLRSSITFGSRVRLLSGWHDLEEGTYRWTGPDFAVILQEPVHRGARLYLRFTLVPGSVDKPVTVAATVDGFHLRASTYSEAGEHVYADHIPQNCWGKSELQIRFVVDRVLTVESDARELGLLVSFWKAGARVTDDAAPLGLM